MNEHQLKRLAEAKDPRFQRIAAKMGYKTRAMQAGPGVDDLAAARAEYEAKMGKKPFHGWDAKTIREKMAGAEK